jgi:hypothetical protein
MQTRSITRLESLRAKAAATTATKKFEDDSTLWKPTKDKLGNSKNLIRFLPEPKGEDTPFVMYYHHAFQGPSGKWLIDLCPSTIHTTGYPSDHCPICGLVNGLYRTGREDDKAVASKMKRTKVWLTNILVVTDGAKPEHNGNVYKYSFGLKQWEKLAAMLIPDDETDTPLDIFDPVEGANFQLVTQKLGGYINYDKSKFSKVSRIGTDEEIDAVLAKLHPLATAVHPSKFKSKAELSDRLEFVMNSKPKSSDEDGEVDYSPVTSKARVVKTTAPQQEADDDNEAMFAEMVAQNRGE